MYKIINFVYLRVQVRVYTIAMLFGHLRVLYSVYRMYPLYHRVYFAGLGIAITYCAIEIGRVALRRKASAQPRAGGAQT